MLLTVLNAPLFYIEHRTSACQQTDFFYDSFTGYCLSKAFPYILSSQQYQMVSIVGNQFSYHLFYFIASNIKLPDVSPSFLGNAMGHIIIEPLKNYGLAKLIGRWYHKNTRNPFTSDHPAGA